MNNLRLKKIIVAIIIVIVLLLQGQALATGGQASGISGTLYRASGTSTTSASYFFELIRSMETSTGTLGVESNMNTTNYIDSSGNGIDCHLEKNTEYGTITIFAASEYGNKSSNDNTSTGANKTGVFQMSGGTNAGELVANTLQQTKETAKIGNNALTNADSRYVNEYIGTAKYSIPGDGIIDTDGWSARNTFIGSTFPIFSRGVTGIFGYDNNENHGNNRTHGCRAVVVCGSGL